VKLLLETIRSQEFKERVTALGGYDPTKSGEFWKEVS
jgi:hypothetical protein